MCVIIDNIVGNCRVNARDGFVKRQFSVHSISKYRNDCIYFYQMVHIFT